MQEKALKRNSNKIFKALKMNLLNDCRLQSSKKNLTSLMKGGEILL
jgi:hypothetical protein